MRILFITDPLAHFKLAKDSTYAMMVESATRGHHLFFCEAAALTLIDNTVKAEVSSLTLASEQHTHASWYTLAQAQQTALRDFDAVIMRKDPPFDIEYVTATWLLSCAQTQGANVFNHPDAIRAHSEKIAIAEFPQFIAPTLVTRDIKHIQSFHRQYQDIIIKPLDGMGGMGVFRIGADGLNLNAIIETLGEQGQRSLMAQRFIPEIQAGDKRILLIAGQVVPFALARIPQAGEIRGNLAAGGIGQAQPLSPRDHAIAQALAPILWQRGLFLVGLDIIGEYLTEINVTSPTCFREITEQTGFNVAAMFIDALERAII
ncbi:MAG: glutathione synthase [Ottowia sp.]|nr:glutathione synthase [Ottowia sp.]